MKIRTGVLAATAVAGLLAGCANVVDGSGSTAGSSGPSASSTADFPSASALPPSTGAAPPSATVPSLPASGTPPTTNFVCPHIVYRTARLSFDCITTGLVSSTTDQVWPLTEYKSVESTGWAVEMGAGHWGPPAGESLAAITRTVRKRMLDGAAYGTSPTVTTTSARDTTVAGVKAHVLQTTFTLNPAYARTRKTRVKIEKSWIIALQIGANDVSLWYASIPDLVQSLWTQVPDFIATIRVT